MREVLPALLSALERGDDAAIAIVVRTWGSSPRPPGSALGLTSSGRVIGSVSGGCVEGAVVEVAAEVLRTGRSCQVDYGVADEDALAAGLPCGGSISVLVQPVTPVTWPDLEAIVASLAAGEPLAVAVPLPDDRGPDAGADAGPHVVARTALATDRTGVVALEAGREAFVLVIAPPPCLVIVGATATASALADLGRLLGYHVTVVDPRPAFATSARVPGAHEVVADWPHRWLAGQALDARAAVCVLSHDARVDVPVLEAALRSPAGYVGLLGSRRTQADRAAGLRAAGVSSADISRVRGPIGLDLGASTPEEIAVAVAAELVACRRGGSGLPLSRRAGPLPADGVS